MRNGYYITKGGQIRHRGKNGRVDIYILNITAYPYARQILKYRYNDNRKYIFQSRVGRRKYVNFYIA